jgi:hypothetical protein
VIVIIGRDRFEQPGQLLFVAPGTEDGGQRLEQPASFLRPAFRLEDRTQENIGQFRPHRQDGGAHPMVVAIASSQTGQGGHGTSVADAAESERQLNPYRWIGVADHGQHAFHHIAIPIQPVFGQPEPVHAQGEVRVLQGQVDFVGGQCR